MVQRCIDALAGSRRDRRDPPGRHRQPARHQPRHPGGPRRGGRDRAARRPATRSTSGVVNGERFAVMAGAGFDALMIRDADGGLKDRSGALAYVWTGAAAPARRAGSGCASTSTGTGGSTGEASCVLVGNVGTIIGGVTGLRRRRARRRTGSRSASSPPRAPVQWARVLARMAAEPARTARRSSRPRGARKVDIRLDRTMPYELDGGDRKPTKRLKVRVEPARDHGLRARGRAVDEHRRRSSPRRGSSAATTPSTTLRSTGRRRLAARRVPAPAAGRRLQPRPLAGLRDGARAACRG